MGRSYSFGSGGSGIGTPDRIPLKPIARPEVARTLYSGGFHKAFSRGQEINTCIHKRFGVDTQTIGGFEQQATEGGRRIH